MMTKYKESELKSLQERATTIRKHVIDMTYKAQSGHPGGSLSATDIITALYFHIMDVKPEDPAWEDRDRFVLSKGHAAPALYGALAEKNYFPVSDLIHLREMGHHLQGHPDMRKTPGVEASTGSEGQGLSIGVGMCLAAKLNRKPYRIYVMCGDGEMQCGQIWEAAMSASHYKLDNLTAFVDRNMLQIDGSTEEVMSIDPITDKWEAFGWHVIEINGHSFKEILDAIGEAKRTKAKPTMIIAHTVKGKGVSFMEGAVGFHGKAPNDEEYTQAMKELGGLK